MAKTNRRAGAISLGVLTCGFVMASPFWTAQAEAAQRGVKLDPFPYVPGSGVMVDVALTGDASRLKRAPLLLDAPLTAVIPGSGLPLQAAEKKAATADKSGSSLPSLPYTPP